MLNDLDLSASSINTKYKNRKPLLNPIKNRLLILSPAVAAGLEREANKTDFESLDDKSIGKGGFGSVYKVQHKKTKKIYAIKVINKENIIKQKLVEQTNREIEIMYKLDHPHIIKLYSHFEDDEDFCLILQYASHGQLYSLIRRIKKLDQKTCAQYLREIISALKFLHSQNPPIIHRDIKPENVLLDDDGRCKLCDFGWSNFDNGDVNRNTFCGTPEYLAPEMISKAGHNESVDIWALGVLMFELLAGKTPFNYKGNRMVLFNNIKQIKISWTDDFPPLAKDLISKILKLNPKERLTLDQIKEHQWFSNLPEIRPVLKVYKFKNFEEKLQSHCLHKIYNIHMILAEEEPKSKDLLFYNKSNINSKKVELTKNLKIHCENPISEANNIKKEEEEKEKETQKSYNLISSMEIASRQNQIRVDKNKYEKEIRELTELRKELPKKINEIFELKKLLEKYKSQNQSIALKNQKMEEMERELNEKSEKLMNIQNSNKLIQIDLTNSKKDLNKLQKKYEELLDKNKELQSRHNKLQEQYNLLETSKSEEITNLESQLQDLQSQIISTENNGGQGGFQDQNESMKIIKVINNQINEMFKFCNQKIPNIISQVKEREQKDIEERNKISADLDYKLKDLGKNIKAINTEFNDEKTKILNKKYNDLLEENEELKRKLRKQVNENTKKSVKETKNKDIIGNNSTILELKNKISRLEELNEIALESKNVAEEKFKYQQTYANTINEKYTKCRQAKETYKNFFLSAEEIFNKYVKNKDLRELIYFNDYKDPDIGSEI